MNLYRHKTPTTDPIIPQATIQSNCAWCLQEAGQAQGEGSHDICPRHRTAMELLSDQIKDARAQRRAQRGR